MTAHPAGLLILFALGAAACLNLAVDDTGPAVTAWETQLAPEPDYPNLSGQTAAVSGPDGTSVSIEITGAEAGATLTWRLGTGTCPEPGPQLGPDSDYPALLPSLSGSASAETHLGPRLSLENTYHSELRSADASRIACGNLEPRSTP
jgi:hypothetical protein